ncbi:MAG: biopolymer transporter ExbD [Candidatus Omnitrophica bacterium]|nr:biopolymer transporter ExbD [Candidatus Omnitrophota bacterium]MDD5671794.1 biopolymer transporter ExbD [Candidatus Omnitrophota bacterium]
MISTEFSEHQNPRPFVPMAPLIDIVFITLIFYMTLSIFYQFETELSISVPKSEQSQEVVRSPGEIIINVDRDGKVIVNQRHLQYGELGRMLKQISVLYPNQPVIIRADKKTYHEYVVKVLDACAAANIWNISFSTLKDEKKGAAETPVI